MNVKAFVKKLIPKFVLDFYHWLWVFFGALFFIFPSKKLTIIGVTGTSGKSTTVDFITRILEEAGNKVASNSSIRFKVADTEWKNELKMGMPGRFFMQDFLRQAVTKKCNYAVLEVTSEGIKQYRHKFIRFNTAVFTNLTPEHIESHGGFENYRNEKLKLFKATKDIHVVNIDDPNARYFLDVPSKEIYLFGIEMIKKNPDSEAVASFIGKTHWIKNKNANIKATNVVKKADGTDFEVQGVTFHLHCMGDFNVYNALAAISVALAQGISLKICKQALEKVNKIPGRMEIVSDNPLVLVDYAHTPEQLELAYQSLNPKPLVCVLGSCGGGRDKWKRPVLGQIAQKYCKEIIITNEDPYDENPMDIINQVAQDAGQSAKKILDRKEAIETALKLAKPEEAVMITGKGSETVMCVAGGKRIPWSDAQIVRDALVK